MVVLCKQVEEEESEITLPASELPLSLMGKDSSLFT